MKNDRVLLQLWSGQRERILKELAFYHEQSKNRLLGTFSNMGKEADEYAEQEYERLGQYFNPEWHDPGDFAESAYEKGIDFYGLLEDLRDHTILGITAGMYHEWEKQLRDWLHRELLHLSQQEKLQQQIWKVNIADIFEFLDGCGWDIKSQPFYTTLDSCRLVVNVYKHGMGGSFNDLKSQHRQFLKKYAFDTDTGPSAWTDFADHTHLVVTADDIDKFYQGFVNFWKFVPENTLLSQVTDVPKWFEKAVAERRSA